MTQDLGSEAANDWGHAEPVLKDWLRRARESQHTHYELARHYNGLNSLFSLPVIIINTVMATSVFASLQTNVSSFWKVVFGLASVLAASIAAIQAYLRFVERSERHRRLAASYSAVRRSIEEALALPIHQRGEIRHALASVRTELDHLAQESPDIPRFIWKRTLKIAERDRALSRDEPTVYDSQLLDRDDAERKD
jgi:hypothetical protein